MILALVPLFLLVVGLIVHYRAKDPKTAEAGRLAYAVGLFFLCWAMAGVGAVHFGNPVVIETAPAPHR